jgi:hypothetical protein
MKLINGNSSVVSATKLIFAMVLNELERKS